MQVNMQESGIRVLRCILVVETNGWLNLVRLYSLYKILYPKRRIESYSIMGTIIPPKSR